MIEPNRFADLQIPNEYRSTICGERFLIFEYFSGEDSILMFTKIENMRYLSNSRFWIMDGTFKTVPLLYRQLYTIHGTIGTENLTVMPLVYALLTSKTQEIYSILFESLTECAGRADILLDPLLIISDFETATINAARQNFPNAIQKGCFFHFSKNIWRKIQEYGLQTEYVSDPELQLSAKELMAMSFLPSNEIKNSFEMCKSMLPTSLNPIVDYIDKIYINGRIRLIGSNNLERRTPPLFPPNFWSVHDQVQNGLPRNQNAVESWHNRWNQLVGRPHVGINKLIENLRDEQHAIEMKIQDVLAGRVVSVTPKRFLEKETRISTVMGNRTNGSLKDFLRGIAHNI